MKPGDCVLRGMYVGCAQVLWRYTVLYMTERCYESGGRVWDQVFNNVCWCLFICIFFTGSFAFSPHRDCCRFAATLQALSPGVHTHSRSLMSCTDEHCRTLSE